MSTFLPPARVMLQHLQQKFQSHLRVVWTQETGSTNSDAMSLLKKSPSSALPILVGTNHQQAGRGRSGKVFTTKSKNALLFSMGVCIHLPFHILPILPIAFGIASCQALQDLLPLREAPPLLLKWPNDIMWGDAKLSGILTECSFIQHDTLPLMAVVIGQGINISGAHSLTRNLQRPITDLQSIGISIPAIEVLYHIIQKWQQLIPELNNNTDKWVSYFSDLDYLKNQWVDVFDQEQWVLSGVARGIDTFGRLIIESSLGKSAISVGEISIRKKVLYV